jgi:hypothetical protein
MRALSVFRANVEYSLGSERGTLRMRTSLPRMHHLVMSRSILFPVAWQFHGHTR